MAFAVLLFASSVALTLAAAGFFADRLDHIGPRLGLPESFTGLLTAFAADGPEISSALIALSQGEKRVSLGIVLGANVFNLAAMIGTSAILTGAVRLARRPLLIEATIAVLASLLATGVIVGLLSPPEALGGLVVALIPYLLLVFREPAHISARAERIQDTESQPSLWVPVALAVGAVGLIVLGSAGMVHSALNIADSLGIPASIVGVLIFPWVTCLPNAFTAIRLGLDHRGAALVSETLNSNTINLGFGVILPGVLIGLASASNLVRFDLAWMILMTLIAIVLLARPRGVGRRGGVALVALYLIFLSVHLTRP